MRVERDALGDVPIPEGALRGAASERARLIFRLSGRKPRPALIRALAQVKLAAARANVRLGALPTNIGRAIMTAASEISEGGLEEEFVVDPFQAGAGTSTNMNVNEVIAHRAEQLLDSSGTQGDVHPNDHVNLGQSSNDVFPTALRLALLSAHDDLEEAVALLSKGLRAKAEVFGAVIKAGRTHLQDAVPISLGAEFEAYAGMLDAGERRLRRIVIDELSALPIGGTAIGTGFGAREGFGPIMIAELRRSSGRDELRQADDLVRAIRDLGDFAAFASGLKGLSLALLQVCNDLRLMSMGPRTGLSEIRLPALQPGSSMMPGKVNPAAPEAASMVAMRVIGMETTISWAVAAGQLELNVMTPVIAEELLEGVTLLRNAAVLLADHCVAGIVADAERCASYASASTALVTALVPAIGYDRAAEVASEAVRSGRSISAVLAERGVEDAVIALTEPTNFLGTKR